MVEIVGNLRMLESLTAESFQKQEIEDTVENHIVTEVTKTRISWELVINSGCYAQASEISNKQW